jgi:release factor glutamine methyltransferase
MATPYERIAAARAVLVAAGIPSQHAALDAEVLARHALAWDRATLLARGRDPEPSGFEARYRGLIERRAKREPVAQIVGRREFWGLDFEVTRDVLVPRPETEMIVEEAVAFAREHPCRTVIDVGTGTGCIAVAIARELPHVHVVAVDSSEAALEVAGRNAARLGVGDRVTLQHSDLFERVTATADLIVSNPPYVPPRDERLLEPEVVDYEPRAALFGGGDGLDTVRRLLGQAHARLAAGGRVVVEFGFAQEDAVRDAATAAGWSIVRVRSDLQGIPRTIVLCPRSHD